MLHGQVAYLTVTVKRKGSPLSPEPRNGYAVAIEPDLVVANAFIVKDADRVLVRGTKGELEAKVVLFDIERRVALLRTAAPVSSVGLKVVTVAPIGPFKRDMEVFALVAAHEHAGVLSAVVIDSGEMPEYGGHPRIDLELEFGMPLFDNRARYVGFSRVVAWDMDKNMVVPMLKVREARTSTGAAAQKKSEKKEERPWWGR